MSKPRKLNTIKKFRHPSLEVVSTNCFSCGELLIANLPFLTKGYVGVTSADCTCGDTKSGCRSSSTRTMEEHISWSSVMNKQKIESKENTNE